MRRELLVSITKKDFDVQWFSGSGAGGQYRNKHQNCVRLRHKDSAVTVTGQSYRNRIANLKEAFNNLTKHPKFKIWFSMKVNEATTKKTIEQRVDEAMCPENLLIECKDNRGRWVPMIEK